MASGSLPSEEVQLLAQLLPSFEHAQNVNVSTSTMGSAAGVSQFLVSPLLTPNTVPLSPPPIINKTTKKLPDIPDLFESLDTFVSSEGPSKEKPEVSGSAKKRSKAEKMTARALTVSTKTHKIMCGLPMWTMEVHALAWPLNHLLLMTHLSLNLNHPQILGIQIPESFLVLLPILFADD